MTDNKAEAERLADSINSWVNAKMGSSYIYCKILLALDAAEQRGREKALDEAWLKAVSIQRLGYSIGQLLPEIRAMKGEKR